MNRRLLHRCLLAVASFFFGSLFTYSMIGTDIQEHKQMPCPVIRQSQTHSPLPLPLRSNPVKFSESEWILDCITWERKWEVTPSQNTQLHAFKIDSELGAEELPLHRQETFQEIFSRKDWPANDPLYKGMQVSGPGAQLRHAQGAIATLHNVITRIKILLGKPKIRLLDLPCGDFQWMQHFLKARNDIIYTGIDIVPELIKHNRRNFDRYPRTEFLQWDIVNAPLRNRTYDLVLCRDMLQHLWRADAVKALSHISQSGAQFLLATNFLGTTHNEEVEKDALGSRKSGYNLELPPFMLETPICSSYDWNVEHLSLWRLPLLQKQESVLA
ncbi:hypothetical protein CAPTEDRAFT_207517 [Capitella teleta]|uniref:Methyltransferase domain-containing protein n=1 Tax=Capitella teleta TaxID=283909 RepID=R7U3T2_CAPTE|nr:hypothetical protein CAPTEDRAFT_207517 [Capitella teleta]|eukprot:ELU00654.1 hypothetical protein CAPTEDRAFT_207517 [Capitella teleta]